MDAQAARERTTLGLFYGIGAYLIWGLLPVFMKMLAAVPAAEILAHRILWSLLLLGLIVTGARGWRRIGAVLRTPRLLGLLALTAALIAGNWFLYIWAVNNAHVLDTSLGYFINPLLNVALGVVVLRERLARAQLVAVLLAAAGVAWLGYSQGGLPWISLTLAVSFGLYGLLRKMAPVEPLTGLFVETLLLAPASLFYLLYIGSAGAGSFGPDGQLNLLLVTAGVLTAIPLLMFSASAKRLRFATVGLLQYIAPSLIFLLAVVVYHEPLTQAHIVAFVLIWTGLAIFALDALRAERSRRLAQG